MNRIFIVILSQAAITLMAPAAIVEKQAQYFVQNGSITEVGIARPFPNGANGDTANKTYSGDFLGTIAVDCHTLEIQSYTFDGGTIQTTPYNLEFFSTIVYPNIGLKSTYFNRQSTTINYSPDTHFLPPGIVGPDGSLAPFQHQMFASNGVLATVRSIVGSQQPRIIYDYINFPDNVPFFGEATLTVEEVSSTLYQRRIRALMTIEVDIENTITMPGLPSYLATDIVETEVGTIQIRSNQINLPSCFGKWASDNHLINPDPEDRNPYGIPYAILMALALPVETTCVPASIEHTENGPIAKITLPEGGLEHPLDVEYTTDLTNPIWADLPDIHFLNGANSLDYGKTGEPTFSFPSGTGGFIRFVSVVE